MSDSILFRRCPRCGQVEIVGTGEVVTPGNHAVDKCPVDVESWVEFSAPRDWRPAGDERG